MMNNTNRGMLDSYYVVDYDDLKTKHIEFKFYGGNIANHIVASDFILPFMT